MNNISFKATNAGSTTILVRRQDGEFTTQPAYFAKMNRDSKMDYYSASDVADLWVDVRPNYVKSIQNHASIIDEEKRDVYFFTTQEKNYRKIRPEQVIGMFEVTHNPNSDFINFIQSHPNAMHGAENRLYKNVGQEMVNKIDKLSNAPEIFLKTLKKLTQFYAKYGYRIVQDGYPYVVMKLKRY